MPRRTIAQARWTLGNVIANAPGHVAAAYKEVLEEAETKARREARATLLQLERHVRELRDGAISELTEVRVKYDELRNSSADSRVLASDYARHLIEMRRRQDQAEGKLAEAHAEVERVKEIEADPVAYYDGLTSRHPQLLEDFPW